MPSRTTRASSAAPAVDAPDAGLDPRVAETSYEQARDELAEVVAALEAGGLSLDESLRLWERGEALARMCMTFLEGARARVEAALAAAADEDATG